MPVIRRTRPKTVEQFMRFFKGVPASRVWKGFNRLTPGIVWNKRPKSYMAERWASGRHHGEIHTFSLAQIMAAIEAAEHPDD